MLPVFMILHSKIYFMRAPARQRKYRIKELYRQTEGTPEGVPFVISTAERERRETPPSTLVNQCRPLLGRVGTPGPTGAVQTNHADQGSGVMRSGGELRQSRKRSHSGVSRPTGAVQTNRADLPSIRPAPSAAHCYARKDARSQRRANPKRRRTAFDDTAVLIASPAF